MPSRSNAVARPIPPPPRALPLLYLGAAHAGLILAFAALALDPRTFAGFFYHPRMLAVVHLLTLGWISCSILGAIYVVGPMALRMPMRASWVDYAAFVFVVVGAAGMVSHLWIERFEGMAWSAGMVLAGMGAVAVRVLRGLSTARVPASIKLHIVLAFVNVLIAGSMGMLLGFNKERGFLHGPPLSFVYAHAHLAAVGWVGMMVAGTGYRLLPMVLPAAMPSGGGLWASAILIQAGATGLFFTLAAGSGAKGLSMAFGLLAVAGFGAFLGHVVWMTRHRRPPPAGTSGLDYGVLHAAQAMAYLVLAAGLGLYLTVAPPAGWSARAAALYGVAGLAGFQSQMVLGIGSRLYPWFSVLQAVVHGVDESEIAPPRDVLDRRLQGPAFLLWTAGVPVLGAGFFLERSAVLGAGAWMLLTSSALFAANSIRMARHALR